MSWRDLVPFRKKSVSVRKESMHPFDRLHNEIDTVFDDFFRGFHPEPFSGHYSRSFSPDIDVAETDKGLKVVAELPGMDEKDIDVLLSSDSLTITGEKRAERESSGKEYYYMERSYGSFSRMIPLPFEVESEHVEAHFQKGILTVKVPKSAKATVGNKKVEISAD
ncbi:MAG: Hsp20/alpha crystallin family protein [Nitrospira sp.]|nr:Hsp20/alpha crystallin family protein [bacterium]MBL7049237.1 Hsp20/alpha crystallin family protein [Nitrospira sp.]